MTPPWFPLYVAAYHRNRKDRAVQIASVSPEGLPEVRTVILRGCQLWVSRIFLVTRERVKVQPSQKHPF